MFRVATLADDETLVRTRRSRRWRVRHTGRGPQGASDRSEVALEPAAAAGAAELGCALADVGRPDDLEHGPPVRPPLELGQGGCARDRQRRRSRATTGSPDRSKPRLRRRAACGPGWRPWTRGVNKATTDLTRSPRNRSVGSSTRCNASPRWGPHAGRNRALLQSLAYAASQAGSRVIELGANCQAGWRRWRRSCSALSSYWSATTRPGMSQPIDRAERRRIMGIGRLVTRAVIGGLFIGYGTQKPIGWFSGPGYRAVSRCSRCRCILHASMHSLPGRLKRPAAPCWQRVPLPARRERPDRNDDQRDSESASSHGVWVANGGYEYNLVLIAALLTLVDEGPGRLSVDALRGREHSGLLWALGALGLGAATSTAVIELGRRRHRNWRRKARIRDETSARDSPTAQAGSALCRHAMMGAWTSNSSSCPTVRMRRRRRGWCATCWTSLV